MKYSLDISNFIEEIASLSHSVVFLFLCTVHGRRPSYLLAVLWNSAKDEAPILRPLDVKNQLIAKDPGAGKD